MTSTTAQSKNVVLICSGCKNADTTSKEIYRSSDIREATHLGNAWQKAIKAALLHADLEHAGGAAVTMAIGDGEKTIVLDHLCPRCRVQPIIRLGHICTKCLQALLTGVVPR